MKHLPLILYVALSVSLSALCLETGSQPSLQPSLQPSTPADPAGAAAAAAVVASAARAPAAASAASVHLPKQPAARGGVRERIGSQVARISRSGRSLLTRGLASFYASELQGRRTASGEHYDEDELTAAHRSFPHGTRVRVKNLRNGRSVVVRINDRGPFRKDRIIDLSARAARELRMVSHGVSLVEIEVLRP